MKKRLFFIPVILSSMLLSGCNLLYLIDNETYSASESQSSSSQPSDKVESIAIYPGSVEVVVGQEVLLTANVLPSTAADKRITWKVLDTSKASITQDGALTGLVAGTTKAVATSVANSSIKAECTVTVVNSVTVDSAFKKADPKYTYYDLDNTRYVQNTGEQKVLVIPTYFKNDAGNATENNRQFIEKSFFGTNEECGWRSFAGYYRQASFGKLQYSGHVAPKWYQSTYTTTQVLNDGTSSQYIAAAALTWFQTQYPSFDLSDYDANNDGYIDSLYIIYASDYVIENDETTNLWGYRWSISGSISQTKTYRGSAFSWFSLKFLKDTTTGQTYGGVPEDGSNTRIIIHEHGHMLGLNDYYDTSYSGMDLVGSWDMQSHNVLDWNAFSKYTMGWVEPYYVDQSVLQSKGSASITIKPSSLNGDCIVVRNSDWNGSPFDEYLMIELFNPEIGNNYYDYHYNTNKNLTKSTGWGVKIYHVDARMLDTSGWSYTPTDTVTYHDGTCVVALDNTNKSDSGHNWYNYSPWQNYYLLQMLQRQNTNTFGVAKSTTRNYWTTGDLWKTGHTFSLGVHEGYTNYGPNFFYNQTTFDDGSTLPYGITFDSVSADSATITFTYLG